jgi:hypothetical protein
MDYFRVRHHSGTFHFDLRNRRHAGMSLWGFVSNSLASIVQPHQFSDPESEEENKACNFVLPRSSGF